MELRTKENKEKGITIIALIVTIIVLIILAGITITSLTGDNSIIINSKKAKFRTEIKEIEEQIEMAEINRNEGEDFEYGTLNFLIGRNDEYNEILLIENKELVYDTEKVNEEQVKWLEEMGIHAKNNIIPIYTEEQLAKIGKGEEVTISEVGGIKYTFSSDANYYLQNDIICEGGENNKFVPINRLDGCIDGNYHKIENIYIESSEVSGLVRTNQRNNKKFRN